MTIPFTTIVLAGLALYFAIMLFEGFQSYRRTRSEADYLVAGRSVGPWIAGASLSATQMSAGTFVGLIGVHYLTGASWIWVWSGIWTAYVLIAFFIAPKLRRYSAEHDGVTFPDYVGDRFNSNVARAIAAVLLVVAFLVYMSAQYTAGGIIIETLFGLPFAYGALILLVVTVIYTVFGGMAAVMRTDFLQQVAMALGVLVGLPLVFAYAGGVKNISAVLAGMGPTYLGWHFGFKDLAGFALAFFFSWMSTPQIVTRFYTVRDDRTARQAVAVALFFNLVTATSAALLAMTIRVLYPHLLNADAASTVYAAQILPPILGAVVIVAVLAAIMSTVDSVLLVAGPAFSHDIYYRLINPNASEQTRMTVNRAATLIIGSLPFVLALQKLGLVQFIVAAYASLMGATMFSPVVIGLWWKRASREGAIASMVIGFGIALALFLAGQPPLPFIGKINPVIPGVIGSVIAMYVCSLATRPVPQENLRPFFRDVAQAAPASAKGSE